MLLFCYYVNLLMIILVVLVIVAALFRFQAYIDFFFGNEIFINVRMLLAIPVFILWINNLIVWSKKDKNLGRFIILFFFIGLYSPFYFQKILKNKWQ